MKSAPPEVFYSVVCKETAPRRLCRVRPAAVPKCAKHSAERNRQVCCFLFVYFVYLKNFLCESAKEHLSQRYTTVKPVFSRFFFLVLYDNLKDLNKLVTAESNRIHIFCLLSVNFFFCMFIHLNKYSKFDKT